MNLRPFRALYIVVCLALPTATAQAAQRPSFIVILADDLGFGDLSCYGGSTPTPHLDRLATEGLRFNDFHSSGPVCTPTRAGLLTGRYQQRTGVTRVANADPTNSTHQLGLRRSETTFAEVLSDAGYATALMGKWHLGYVRAYNPLHHGFDEFRGYVSGNIDYISHYDRMGLYDWWNGLEHHHEEGYVTHLITDHSVRFLRENKDRPFCLYVAHEAVHDPLQTPEGPVLRGPDADGTPVTGDATHAVYRRMLIELDLSVGRIAEAVREHGLTENTYVLFLSDNGASRRYGSNGGLRGHKSQLWEGGHRVPAIAWAPGRVPAGYVSQVPAISIDLFPTLLSLAGVTLPAGHPLDGVDLSATLHGGPPPAARQMFWEFRGGLAVRDGPWKFVHPPNKPPSLFDLSRDPAETRDLAASEPARRDELDQAATRWLAAVTTGATPQPEAVPLPKKGARDPRPNVLLLVADDMGWSDIGCYGGEVETPNLDRLALQGMRFAQFYNNAKCTTTRASIVTGLYPRRGQGGLLRSNMVTVGEALGSAGYRTSLSGKWHLGRASVTHPFYRGFEEYYGLLDGCSNFFDPMQKDPKYKDGRVRFSAHNDQRIFDFPQRNYYTTDAYTDHAITTMKRYARTGEPFFIHVCYTAPHYPLHAKPQDIAKYRGKYRMGWEELRRQRYERQLALGLIDGERYTLSETDSRAYPWAEADHDFEDLRMAVYAAMIDAMDQNIGRLLATLQDLDIADNTLVLFFSDNGGCAEEPGGRDPAQRTPGGRDDYVAVGPAWGWAQNAPFRRYKSWVHEGGIRTPCIARWPRVTPRNRITQEVGHIIDLMPTFCEIGAATYPREKLGEIVPPAEGRTLLPILRGGQREGHQYLAWAWSGNRALRRGDWKVVWDKQIKRWELYDLAKDPVETRDLAAAEPARTEALTKLWFEWAAKTEVKY